MQRLIVFMLVFPMVVAMSSAAQTPNKGDIPRFSSISDGLYRGGQPTEKGFQFLKDRGVKTIINLRAEDNSEKAIVEKLGMIYVQLPVDEVSPWSKVPDGMVNKYFELIGNRENYPIFFHCRRGADRTGALAAMYRIAMQSWDAKKAYQEARDIGMRWFYTGLKAQIFDFKGPVQPEIHAEPNKQ
jgi:protein tyrosine/serine phosphatase